MQQTKTNKAMQTLFGQREMGDNIPDFVQTYFLDGPLFTSLVAVVLPESSQ